MFASQYWKLVLLEFRPLSVTCFGFKTAGPVLTTELWEQGKFRALKVLYKASEFILYTAL